MRVIALFGRGNIGKTRCLGHLINLIYRETEGCNRLFEGQDMRITLDYMGHRITICTWGDNEYEERLNIDKIREYNPDIAIVATRTKGETVEKVKRFCEDNHYPLKWVEKFVASFDDISGQEYLNNLQADQILDYIRGLIRGQLYYVDSISPIEGEEKKYHMALIGTDVSEEGFPRSLSIVLNDNQMHYYETQRRIFEDDFVWYYPDSNHMMRYANDAPVVLEMRRESIALRQELMALEVKGETAWAVIRKKIDLVKSYHVNVGHGNCSLILIKYDEGYDLWMVDCSTYDHMIRRDYSVNLYRCLRDIAWELDVDEKSLHISRFMLTHTHSDHYNGLRYLIKQGMIDSTTLMYVNTHYDCASPVWSTIMKSLKGMKCKFVEPISGNLTNGAIRILHPECSTYMKSVSVPADKKRLCRVVANVNDSSVVYSITLQNIVMTLPGDLQKAGLKEMSGHSPCRGELSKTRYYMVSHHGSLNGHPDVNCMSKGAPYPKPLCCVSQGVKKAILMGRNDAYPGIYSPTVIDHWENALGVLEYTEKAPHFLELNWTNDTVAMK